MDLYFVKIETPCVYRTKTVGAVAPNTALNGVQKCAKETAPMNRDYSRSHSDVLDIEQSHRADVVECHREYVLVRCKHGQTQLLDETSLLLAAAQDMEGMHA